MDLKITNKRDKHTMIRNVSRISYSNGNLTIIGTHVGMGLPMDYLKRIITIKEK
jgi:hypothetical protein